MQVQRIAAAAAVLGWAAVAHADPQRLAWSTYLYAEPGRTSAVTDELEHDQVVDVLHCEGAWCAVQSDRSTGWIASDALRNNMKTQDFGATLNADAGCVSAGVPGYVGLKKQTYCGVTPAR
jgi:SH3-like domain-containing protein